MGEFLISLYGSFTCHNCSTPLEYMEGELVGLPVGGINILGDSHRVAFAFPNNCDSGIACFVDLIAQESIFHCIALASSHHTAPPTKAPVPPQIVPQRTAQAPCPAIFAKYLPSLPHFIVFPLQILTR